MRKIKFRVWNKDLKAMLEVNFYQYLEYSYPKGNTLMQYTGLKDVNGKEIYEGDIVEWEYLGFHISEIKQDLIGYYVENTGHIKDVIEKFRFDFAFKNLNVIGNIYENPELLEKGNK